MPFPLQNQRHSPRCTEVLIHAFIYWPYPIWQTSGFLFPGEAGNQTQPGMEEITWFVGTYCSGSRM